MKLNLINEDMFSVDPFDVDWEDYEEVDTCAWCGEEYPVSELHKEIDLGLLCDYCIQAIKSRGEELTFEA